MEHTLSITKPFIVFVNTETFKKLDKVKPTCRTYKYVVHLDSKETNAAFLSYEKMVQNDRSVSNKLVQPKITTDQTTLILFSSGSTGLPKAVMLSNQLLLYLTNAFRYWPSILWAGTDPDHHNGRVNSRILKIFNFFSSEAQKFD